MKHSYRTQHKQNQQDIKSTKSSGKISLSVEFFGTLCFYLTYQVGVYTHFFISSEDVRELCLSYFVTPKTGIFI